MRSLPIELRRIALDSRARSAAERVRAVAEAQGGVIGRKQALACGLSNGRFSRWVKREWLLRLFPGVYALGHRAISPRARLVAALLFAGPDSGLSHPTAADQWRIWRSESTAIHVVTRNHRVPVPGIVIHRPVRLNLVTHNGLPVTTVAQTLVDIAPSCSERELRKALAEADYRKLINAGELRAVMGRGHPGSNRLRGAIRGHMPELARTLSWLEDDLLLLCEREAIPLPQPNAWVGPYRPDALWPDAMLIVELDGRDAHSSPDQRRRDAQRAAYLRDLGYLILRFSWTEVTTDPGRVAAEIRKALGTRLAANCGRSRPGVG